MKPINGCKLLLVIVQLNSVNSVNPVRIAEKFEPIHIGCYHRTNGQTQFHRTAGLRADPDFIRGPGGHRDGQSVQLASCAKTRYLSSMSTQEILLEEIKHQPEPVLRELRQYLDFLKRQHATDALMDSVVADTWENWSGAGSGL